MCVHWRDLHLLKPTPGPPKVFQYLTRAEDVVMFRLQIGIIRQFKSHILPRGPRLVATIAVSEWPFITCSWSVQCYRKSCDEYYTADWLKILFETIPGACIVEFWGWSWILIFDINDQMQNNSFELIPNWYQSKIWLDLSVLSDLVTNSVPWGRYPEHASCLIHVSEWVESLSVAKSTLDLLR